MSELTVGTFIDSLRSHIRAMNEMWRVGVSDLTLEHVNHKEREGVLPIAFTLNHYIRHQDFNISTRFLREPPLWDAEDWVTRVGATVNALGREESVEDMEPIRFGDFDAWKQYQEAVLSRTDRFLPTISEEMLLEIEFPRVGDRPSFPSMVVGPGNPLRKLEILECFILEHGTRHLGELEHARALVGLKGIDIW